MLFGVIMRRMNNVGVSVPKSGVDEWGRCHRQRTVRLAG